MVSGKESGQGEVLDPLQCIWGAVFLSPHRPCNDSTSWRRTSSGFYDSLRRHSSIRIKLSNQTWQSSGPLCWKQLTLQWRQNRNSVHLSLCLYIVKTCSILMTLCCDVFNHWEDDTARDVVMLSWSSSTLPDWRGVTNQFSAITLQHQNLPNPWNHLDVLLNLTHFIVVGHTFIWFFLSLVTEMRCLLVVLHCWSSPLHCKAKCITVSGNWAFSRQGPGLSSPELV